MLKVLFYFPGGKMKKGLLLFICTLLLLVIPACSIGDKVVSKFGYAKITATSEQSEKVITEELPTPTPLPTSFVYTGDGDPELAGLANSFMKAVNQKDSETTWNMFSTTGQSQYNGNFSEWQSWVNSNEVESWTIQTMHFDEQGGCVISGNMILNNETNLLSLVLSDESVGMKKFDELHIIPTMSPDISKTAAQDFSAPLIKTAEGDEGPARLANTFFSGLQWNDGNASANCLAPDFDMNKLEGLEQLPAINGYNWDGWVADHSYDQWEFEKAECMKGFCTITGNASNDTGKYHFAFQMALYLDLKITGIDITPAE
jgi:hypothetical protein